MDIKFVGLDEKIIPFLIFERRIEGSLFELTNTTVEEIKLLQRTVFFKYNCHIHSDKSEWSPTRFYLFVPTSSYDKFEMMLSEARHMREKRIADEVNKETRIKMELLRIEKEKNDKLLQVKSIIDTDKIFKV